MFKDRARIRIRFRVKVRVMVKDRISAIKVEGYC